jgi:hypothetical protein
MFDCSLLSSDKKEELNGNEFGMCEAVLQSTIQSNICFGVTQYNPGIQSSMPIILS